MSGPSFVPVLTPGAAKSHPRREGAGKLHSGDRACGCAHQILWGSLGASSPGDTCLAVCSDTGDAWHNCNRAKLVAVVIERKSLLQMQLVDHSLPGPVCQTPRLIGKLAEGLPTQQDVGCCEVIHSGQCATKEWLAHDHSVSRLPTCLQERRCLIDDVVRR
jgi:hypothetical protein